ncbi:recombinase family protein [Mycolicibacterium sphagni]|uniref:recombinase family protein n=1 Tax=Mycolicibacterium sphagni TaxID=1786 RepID=UPI0021F2F3D0|nr:recombinase family protein [Mycolicibacterium sphagni]MCV7179546.1 recombinase family protein [Mycolicibacterium sphagni]
MPEDPKAQVRAGCYCRISSDPNDKRAGVTRQKEDTTALCEVKEWEVAGFYIDNDRSASNGNSRPEWERLLDDVKAGKIDAIAAWDQDRGWRMMSELEDLRRFFKSLDRKVLLATTGQGEIDLDSPTGILAAQIKTAVSEHEIAMMRVRQLRAARQKAEQGKPQWKRAFGYLHDTRPKGQDDGTRVIDEAAQKLIQAGYLAVVNDRMTITEVADMWNQDGNPKTPSGKEWAPSLVSQFLRNPRNAGLRTHNGVIVMDKDGKPVKATWPPLVDEDLWRAAQTQMNSRPGATQRRTVQRHLLTGVMLCGNTELNEKQKKRLGRDWCRGTLSGHHIAGHKIAYACKQCRGVAVRAEHVEPLILNGLVARLSRPDAVKLLRKKLYNPAEAKKLDTDEAILRAKLVQLGRDFASAPPEFTQAAISDVNDKLDAIERKRQDQERLRVLDGIPLGTDQVRDVVEGLSPVRVRSILRLLWTITVEPVGKGSHVFNPDRIVVVERK